MLFRWEVSLAWEQHRRCLEVIRSPTLCLVMCPQGLLVWMCWSPCNGIMRT